MKNNKIQITGVATAETSNGNGHKPKKSDGNIRVISYEDFYSENSVKITPYFSEIKTKQAEVFANMEDLANAKLFLDNIIMQAQGDSEMIAGLMMLFDALNRMIENPKDRDLDHPTDFIYNLQVYLFHWLNEESNTVKAYIEAVRSQNYAVGELTDNSQNIFTSPEFILPKKSPSQKAKNVSYFPTEEKTAEPVSAKAAEPSLFEIVRNADEKELGTILSALLDNETLPFQMHNEIFEGIGICMPPDHEDSNFEPEFVEKCIRFTNENSKTKKLASLAERLSAVIEDPNLPEPLHDGILDLLTEMFNSHVDQSEFLKYEKSPEYISKLLCGYFSKCGNKAA